MQWNCAKLENVQYQKYLYIFFAHFLYMLYVHFIDDCTFYSEHELRSCSDGPGQDKKD